MPGAEPEEHAMSAPSPTVAAPAASHPRPVPCAGPRAAEAPPVVAAGPLEAALSAALRAAPRRLAAAAAATDRGDRVRSWALARYCAGLVPLLAGSGPGHHDVVVATLRVRAALAEVVSGAPAAALGEPLGALADQVELHLGATSPGLTAGPFRCGPRAGGHPSFTVPFVLAELTAAERRRVLATAPLAFRVRYRLHRASHERLRELVFGPAGNRGLGPAGAP
jgi:hypothetical protein